MTQKHLRGAYREFQQCELRSTQAIANKNLFLYSPRVKGFWINRTWFRQLP